MITNKSPSLTGLSDKWFISHSHYRSVGPAWLFSSIMAPGLSYFCPTTPPCRSRALVPVHRYEKDTIEGTYQLLAAFFVHIPIDEISDTQCHSNSKKPGEHSFPVWQGRGKTGKYIMCFFISNRPQFFLPSLIHFLQASLIAQKKTIE